MDDDPARQIRCFEANAKGFLTDGNEDIGSRYWPPAEFPKPDP